MTLNVSSISLNSEYRAKAQALGNGNVSKGVRRALDSLPMGPQKDGNNLTVTVNLPREWVTALQAIGGGDVSEGFREALKNPHAAGLFISP